MIARHVPFPPREQRATRTGVIPDCEFQESLGFQSRQQLRDPDRARFRRPLRQDQSVQDHREEEGHQGRGEPEHPVSAAARGTVRVIPEDPVLLHPHAALEEEAHSDGQHDQPDEPARQAQQEDIFEAAFPSGNPDAPLLYQIDQSLFHVRRMERGFAQSCPCEKVIEYFPDHHFCSFSRDAGGFGKGEEIVAP